MTPAEQAVLDLAEKALVILRDRLKAPIEADKTLWCDRDSAAVLISNVALDAICTLEGKVATNGVGQGEPDWNTLHDKVTILFRDWVASPSPRMPGP